MRLRAYDTQRKMWVDGGEIILGMYGEDRVTVIPNSQSYIGDCCHNGEPQRNRFLVSEYALRKDVNGNDIFVGDILSNRWQVEVFRHSKTGAFMVKFRINPGINKPMLLTEWFSRRTKAGTIEEDGLIIGNIYEL